MRACFHRLDFANFVKVSFPQWFIYFANGQRLKFPFSLSSKLRVRPITITLLPDKKKIEETRKKKRKSWRSIHSTLDRRSCNPADNLFPCRRTSPWFFRTFCTILLLLLHLTFFTRFSFSSFFSPIPIFSLPIELGGRLRWHGVVDRQKRELRNATNLFSLTYIFGPKWRGLTDGYSIQSHWHYSWIRHTITVVSSFVLFSRVFEGGKLRGCGALDFPEFLSGVKIYNGSEIGTAERMHVNHY